MQEERKKGKEQKLIGSRVKLNMGGSIEEKDGSHIADEKEDDEKGGGCKDGMTGEDGAWEGKGTTRLPYKITLWDRSLSVLLSSPLLSPHLSLPHLPLLTSSCHLHLLLPSVYFFLTITCTTNSSSIAFFSITPMPI